MNVSPVYHGGSGNGGTWPTVATVDTDEKVKASSDDITSGYLDEKLTASGSNIANVVDLGGGVQVVDIEGHDELVKVTENDTTPAELSYKLVAGAGIDITVDDPGGNETLIIEASVTEDRFVQVTGNDTTPGRLDTKIGAGTGIQISVNNPGGNEMAVIGCTVTDEKAKVSSNDTTSGYLNGKLVAGTGITLIENNNGGNETLTIASTVTVPDRYSVKWVPGWLFSLYSGSATETNTLWATPEFKSRGWSGVAQNDILSHFIPSPVDWDLSAIVIRTFWFMSSNSSADTHTFTSRGLALSNGNSFNTSFAFSETFSFTTDSAADKLYIASVNCSPTNTPSAGDGICWKMKRTDNDSGTVFFLGAEFKFKLS